MLGTKMDGRPCTSLLFPAVGIPSSGLFTRARTWVSLIVRSEVHWIIFRTEVHWIERFATSGMCGRRLSSLEAGDIGAVGKKPLRVVNDAILGTALLIQHHLAESDSVSLGVGLRL